MENILNAKVRTWHWIVIGIVVLCCLSGLMPPSPPDFADSGFTSVHVCFWKRGQEPMLLVSSADPELIAALARVLRTGRPVGMCRCGPHGSLEFRRPDGTSERVQIVRAHDPQSIEFRFNGGRFRVGRDWFLKVVEPFEIPPQLWDGVSRSE